MLTLTEGAQIPLRLSTTELIDEKEIEEYERLCVRIVERLQIELELLETIARHSGNG